MMKKNATPMCKDKPSIRNISNNQRALKDIKNTIPQRQTLSRQPSNSKLTLSHQSSSYLIHGSNPQSPDQIRQRQINKQVKYTLVNEEMRKLIVQWLLQISHRTNPNLRRQTIFMGIHLFDLISEQLKNLSIHNLQLAALTCLFIAAKYEEIHPESLNKFLQYAVNSYVKQQLVIMEEKILAQLQFKLTFPTRLTHYGLIQETSLLFGENHAVNKKLHSLTLFLLQLSLLDRWEQVSESEIAEAAYFLARKILKIGTNYVSDTVMQSAYKLMGIWKDNEHNVLSYFFDNEKYSFVGGLKIIY